MGCNCTVRGPRAHIGATSGSPLHVGLGVAAGPCVPRTTTPDSNGLQSTTRKASASRRAGTDLIISQGQHQDRREQAGREAGLVARRARVAHSRTQRASACNGVATNNNSTTFRLLPSFKTSSSAHQGRQEHRRARDTEKHVMDRHATALPGVQQRVRRARITYRV